MSALAFDKQAKPFTFHKRTKLLRVRLFRNPRARGTCSQVLDDDGEPLYIDVDTDYPEFRQIIGSVPGLYRLDQCDDDGNEIGDEPAAYVTIDPPRNAQPRDAMSTDVNPLTIIREMAAIQGEALKALSQHQAQILASAADIMRAPYRPAPPPVPVELRNASDNEDDDVDEMDDELEDDDELEEPAPRGVLDQLAAFAQRFGLTDMKQVHKFAHWAMSKLIEFRRETADAKPEAVATAVSGAAPAPVASPAPVPSAPVNVVAAPIVPPSPTSVNVTVAPAAPASVNVAVAPATPVPSASTTAPATVTSVVASTIPTAEMTKSPSADESSTSSDQPAGFPQLTDEQTLHILAINSRLSDEERAIAEHVITRMGHDKMKRWAVELSAMSLDDATATVRALIAEIQQKRRNKAQH